MRKIFYIIPTGCLALALAACSNDKPKIDGERISILAARTSVSPDFPAGGAKVAVPKEAPLAAWSQNGGNAAHNTGNIQAAEQLKKAWKASFGSGSSKRDFLLSEPVVSGGKAFAIDVDAAVSAFDLASGERLWRQRLEPFDKAGRDVSIKGAGLAVLNGKVFATTGFGGVFALSVSDGTVAWRKEIGMPIRIAPAIGADGKLFVQAIDNTLIALSAADGAELWRQNPGAESTALLGGASPAYSQPLDVVIAGFNTGELAAFKASTGSLLWSDFLVSGKKINTASDINAIKAAPAIDGGMAFAAGSNNLLAAIDIRTGERIWEREIGAVSQPYAAGGTLFAVSGANDLLAMEKASGKVIWSVRLPSGPEGSDKAGGSVSGPIMAGGRLIAVASSGYAFTVSPYDGKILGTIALHDESSIAPVAANGYVLFSTNYADLLVYK